MLVTREIAGTVETEGSAEEALPTKRTDRRYMQGIADTIEDALAEPFDSFQNKRLIHMKTYQQKDGSFTSAYTDWEYGSSKLTYEIQLCRTSPSEGIFIMIWARSPSELYTKKIQSSRVKASMRELGYKIDAPDGEEPYFMCTVTKDISELNDELGKRILNHTKKAGILALKIFME